MKTINIIIPYFGSFPNYFQLFLNSCSYNTTVDWTIITDNTQLYYYPQNVKVVHMTFSELKNKIQNRFDFQVSLDSVHKLCEFKPAYGYIFSEYIEGYDFWGYGDLDLIYGDFRKFITDEILDKYPKIFKLGHLTLIKNELCFNEMFKNKYHDQLFYKLAFSNPDNFNFDEEFDGKVNINDLFMDAGMDIFSTSYAADIYTKATGFFLDLGDGKREDKKDAVFIWNNGELYRLVNHKGVIEKEDFLYIHLQKREMKVRGMMSMDRYKIIPNSFENVEVNNPEQISEFKKIKKMRFNLHYFKLRTKNLKTKIKSLTI